MLAEESILAACKAERVLEFPACGQYAAARVAGEFQRPRNEPSCPPEEMERRRLPGEDVFRKKGFRPRPPIPQGFWLTGRESPQKFRLGGRGNWQRGCCFFVDNIVDCCLWKSILPAMIPPAPPSRRHGSGCPDCGTKRGRRCAASGPVPRGCRARWARRPRCRRS